VLNLEEAIIQRAIDNSSVQVELTEILRKLKGEEEFRIYTDGLLASREIRSLDNKRMRIG
jgi:hypothetical protein